MAQKAIHSRPMTKNLEKGFRENGLAHLLEGVWLRTGELLKENENATRPQMMHLKQMLPCIAFYEALLQYAPTREEALRLFEAWACSGFEAVGDQIRRIMKLPGLYKLMPHLFDKMMDGFFGEGAGFASSPVPGAPCFARDVTRCPYAETFKKYNCFELTQFFCKADDASYGSMHKRLLWGRTQTIGQGGDKCDFRLTVKKEGE